MAARDAMSATIFLSQSLGKCHFYLLLILASCIHFRVWIVEKAVLLLKYRAFPVLSLRDGVNY